MLHLLTLLACTSADDTGAEGTPAPTPPGGASHRRAVLDDDGGDRPLTVEVWYPTAAAAPPATSALPDAFLSGEDAATYAALLDAAPAGCPTAETVLAAEAPLADGPWPVVVLSHCHNCIRFSNLAVAEALARSGYVVVAPDHSGNTVFSGELPLTADTLALRRADLGRALDALLGGALGVPAEQLDAEAVGALGHSFGSVSVGLLAQEDDRVRAAMGVAAPMENPLLPGVDIAALDLPLLFLVAGEDNSITEAGNVLIRSNFEAAPGPAWKVEVADAGHWSFSDICGLREDFEPGCGSAPRQTDPDETVTYPDPEDSRRFAADLAVAFFDQTFRGEGEIDLIAEAAAGADLEQRPSR